MFVYFQRKFQNLEIELISLINQLSSFLKEENKFIFSLKNIKKEELN